MSQATFLTSTIHVRFQYKQQVDHIKINMSVFSAYFSLLCKLNKFYERKEMTERIFYEFLWKFDFLTDLGSYQNIFQRFYRVEIGSIKSKYWQILRKIWKLDFLGSCGIENLIWGFQDLIYYYRSDYFYNL